ncbi:hypothetical protein DAETH_31790 [Deinococcus aetherius]|uniref:DUF4402 domain-containing protein n=1 Tax=Deinococcus aetherius TaxID=200252 RepID=A0ABN6RIL9_9DEIO|nr:hypothetical protein DAETH_31790 [Deinococcus aetherius]
MLLLLGAALLTGGGAGAQTGLPSGGPRANSAALLDGQRLTLNVSFLPGEPGGPAYPPSGPFSRANPAYYPVRGNPGTLRLTVVTGQPAAALVLRARAVPAPGRLAALPADRVEYSVNGAPWQASGGVQTVALLPPGGQATYEIALRLRLEGDEPAGEHGVQLTWTVEAR